jgi:hypothetical protein
MSWQIVPIVLVVMSIRTGEALRDLTIEGEVQGRAMAKQGHWDEYEHANRP